MYMKEFAELVNNPVFHLFVALILLDILTGTTKGFKERKASSLVGLTGMLKHVINIILVMALYPILTKLDMEGYAKVVVLFYITFYALSNIENLAVIGVPFPKWVKDKIEILHNEYDENKEDEHE